jgi:sRNA-binding carbon storage regulator CsrA
MEQLISTEELYQTIFKRKSIRKYEQDKLSPKELQNIEKFIRQAKVIDSEIEFEAKIVNADQVKSLISIKAPHYLQFFSEEKGDYLLNAGLFCSSLIFIWQLIT